MPVIVGRILQWGGTALVGWLAAKAVTDVTGDVVDQTGDAANAVETVADASVSFAMAAALGVGAFAVLQAVKAS